MFAQFYVLINDIYFMKIMIDFVYSLFYGSSRYQKKLERSAAFYTIK